ncbi:hypothetical protein ACWOCJ_09820 [Enterococcus pseudoavium]|uniref:hypothetical protein n=1 Tax=Enterococcus pseudoavium TaxID=44007 RepID=UPI0008309EE5|nr:hypothetical protein [Enterococcus pseudoavium]
MNWVFVRESINLIKVIFKKRKTDIWLIVLISLFFFMLGVCFFSLFVNDLGLSEISGFFGAAGAFFAGGISFAGARWNTKRTAEIQKEMSDKNNRLQKEMHQRKIDADLKASARIDWIQKVREETVKFVSSITRLLDFLPSYQEHEKLKHYFKKIVILEFLSKGSNLSKGKISKVVDSVPISLDNDISIIFSSTALKNFEKFDEIEKKLVQNSLVNLANNTLDGKSNVKVIKEYSGENYDKVLSIRLGNGLRMIVAVDEKIRTKIEKIESVEVVSSYMSKSQIQQERDALIDKVKTQANLLKLYFGPSKSDDRNDKILNLVENCTKILGKEKISSNDLVNVKVNTNDLVNTMREYLKIEWDKAKEGK